MLKTVTETNHSPHDIGIAIGDADFSEQAAVLVGLLESTEKYPWAMQCRNIAEALPEETLLPLRVMLGTLTEHLEAVPLERKVRAKTDHVLGKVAALVQELKS